MISPKNGQVDLHAECFIENQSVARPYASLVKFVKRQHVWEVAMQDRTFSCWWPNLFLKWPYCYPVFKATSRDIVPKHRDLLDTNCITKIGLHFMNSEVVSMKYGTRPRWFSEFNWTEFNTFSDTKHKTRQDMEAETNKFVSQTKIAAGDVRRAFTAPGGRRTQHDCYSRNLTSRSKIESRPSTVRSTAGENVQLA